MAGKETRDDKFRPTIDQKLKELGILVKMIKSANADNLNTSLLEEKKRRLEISIKLHGDKSKIDECDEQYLSSYMLGPYNLSRKYNAKKQGASDQGRE